MKIKRFFSKRINIIAFVTVLFLLIGSLFGFVLPNVLFNNQIHAIEMDLRDLAFRHDTVTEVDSTQVLYIYDEGDSTMLTSSGYIEVIDFEIEEHLIHWSHEQVVDQVQTLLYDDDFQNKNYIYYVYVVSDEFYVVTFEDTKEVITFVDGFRSTSLGAVLGFYILSVIFSSTVFSSSLIKQYSLFDPVTNLNTKISLYNRFRNKDLTQHKFTFFCIYNLDNIADAMGARYIDDVLRLISYNISSYYGDSIYQINSKDYVLVSDLEDKNDTVFSEIINKRLQKDQKLISYELKVKTLHIHSSMLEDISINDVLKRFTFTFSKIKNKKATSFHVSQENVEEMMKEQYYQSRLGTAIKSDMIHNFYQPKVDPKTNEIIGAEALSRWVNGEEIISPGNYIHIAESNGLIYDIDLISFKNSIKMIRELKDKNLLKDDFKVSSNFSPLSLKTIQFKQIKDILEEYNVDAKHVSIEITETVVLEFDVIKDLLQEINDYGISIEIDDFSAGNSSFSVLSLLNANVVKLDRGILPETEEDEREKFIYNSLVDISKKLGFKIISEGVENDTQKDFVRDLGVEGVQGYFYSKPLNEGSFIDYISNNK